MPQSPEHPIEKQGPEETLEFLKRNEVRTMAKDVAQLREEEAKKEREKIASMKPEAPAPLKEPVREPEPKASSLMPAKEPRFKFPKKPPHFDKVFIRVALILGVTFVLVNVVAFAVWNMKKNGNQVSQEGNLVSPASSAGGPEPQAPEPAPEPQPSLLSLFQTLLAEEDAPGLTKILVEDKVTELPFPFQLKEIIQDGFTVFSFVSQDKKRLGFIFQLQSSEEAQEILKQWEPSMEEDLKTFWNIMGQKGKAYVPFFRQTSYQNTLIRFQTFSVKDFGIVYALKDNMLIITSSLESMKAALDLLLETK